MKYYIQFLEKDLLGHLSEGCGSDAVYQLDGRNSLDVMIDDAYNRVEKLKNVRKGIIGFEIRKGNVEQYITIYKIIF